MFFLGKNLHELLGASLPRQKARLLEGAKGGPKDWGS